MCRQSQKNSMNDTMSLYETYRHYLSYCPVILLNHLCFIFLKQQTSNHICSTEGSLKNNVPYQILYPQTVESAYRYYIQSSLFPTAIPGYMNYQITIIRLYYKSLYGYLHTHGRRPSGTGAVSGAHGISVPERQLHLVPPLLTRP